MRDPFLRDAARDLRRSPTDAERLIWRALRETFSVPRFRRQRPIPPYIVDFACMEARLVVEIDGGQHGGDADLARDITLEAQGWCVLRYWNNDVMENLPGVLADIATVLHQRLSR